MKKFISTLMSLVVCFSLLPTTVVHAAPPPETWELTMTEEELGYHNLSLGTISWDDDLVSGSIVVSASPTDNYYLVKSEEFFKLNDMAHTKKDIAKNAAKCAFKDIRYYAQLKGWWDCKWKIKSASKKKVTATAKVEFKSVSMDRNSQSITIKQTTVKKNGKWKTTYTVNGKKISATNLKKLFT